MENKEPLSSEGEGHKEARVLHPDEMPDSLRKKLWNAVQDSLDVEAKREAIWSRISMEASLGNVDPEWLEAKINILERLFKFQVWPLPSSAYPPGEEAVREVLEKTKTTGKMIIQVLREQRFDEEIIRGMMIMGLIWACPMFVLSVIWRDFFAEIAWEESVEYRERINLIKNRFFSLEWGEVCDLIGFIIREDRLRDRINYYLKEYVYDDPGLLNKIFRRNEILNEILQKMFGIFRRNEILQKMFDICIGSMIESFQKDVERIFKEERAPYKIINGFVTPLISEIEVEEVERALAHKDEWAPVSEHIKKALELFRKRPEPDYLNSIKEATLALETLAKIKTGKEKEKVTLGQLASQVVERLSIHPALQEALRTMLDKLHGWASREHGIRHSEGSTPPISGEAEARLTLVISSALVNYFIAKDC